MNAVAWMVGVSVASWLLIRTALTGDVGHEPLAGMSGPLVCAVASWLAYERVHRADPAALTNVMITALAVKMVFFGGYMFLVLRVLGMQPVPFVVTFAGYFIALHAMEALFLRRLLMDGLRSPRRERA